VLALFKAFAVFTTTVTIKLLLLRYISFLAQL